ncbi:MAG: hypothetical protein JSU59_07160, partial [Nitrospirota bacterium]
MRRSLKVPLVFLCLILSSCYPWLYPTTKGPTIKLQIIAGTTKTIVLDDIDNARNIGVDHLTIFGVGQQVPSYASFRVISRPIGDTTLQLTFEADAKAREDIFKGWVPLRSGFGKPGIISPVTIHVIEPSDDFIPRGARIPSADRIVRDKNGQLVVRDELIVMLPIFAPSAMDSVAASRKRRGLVKRDDVLVEPIVVCPPIKSEPRWVPSLVSFKIDSFVKSGIHYSVTPEEGGYFITPEKGRFSAPLVEPPIFIVPDIGTAERAVCEIAYGRVNVNGDEKEIGGVFIGSIPETRSFQMRFPEVDTLEDLAEKRRLIFANFPAVSAVSRSFVAEGQPANAVDEYHAGNLLPSPPFPAADEGNGVPNITIFNNANVPAAWDLTTGHNNVRVAVIDCDFLHTHSDFGSPIPASNVESISGNKSGCGQHGTKTAGIIGAKGTSPPSTNGPGIAGLAWNIKMRLYDPLNGIDTYAAETYPGTFKSEIAFPTAEAMMQAISDDLTGS